MPSEVVISRIPEEGLAVETVAREWELHNSTVEISRSIILGKNKN
jgi:DNA-binding NarL/FixJ family response regulator